MSTAFKPGFGEKLRLARTAQGLSPADVAAKLKLGARQIESLEAEELGQLPGEVFTRGFVRNYARLVGVDPEQLIIPVDPHAVVAESVTAPSVGVLFSAPGLRRWVLLPLLAMGFFVLLVAVLYYWLRQGEDALVTAPVEPSPASLASMAPPVPVLPVPATPPAASEAVPLAPADTAPSVSSAPAPIPAHAPALTPAPAAAPAPLPPSAVKPATPVTPSPMAPSGVPGKPVATPQIPAIATPPAQVLVAAKPTPPAPAPSASASLPSGQHILRLAPALDSWVQIVDGQGKRYSKLVRAGSSESFVGVAPFKLVVGEAAQVQLTYDGHAIDLNPFIGQKVARLTLE